MQPRMSVLCVCYHYHAAYQTKFAGHTEEISKLTS